MPRRRCRPQWARAARRRRRGHRGRIPRHWRRDGGRGFGFTGGHFHWNWGHDEFRQLVLNAIVWAAKAEVPEGGVPSKPLTVAELEENQDFPKPDNYKPEEIQKKLEEWNGKSS